MTDEEFQFNKCKQILELEQGRHMTADELLTAKAVFYYCKGIELKQTIKQEQEQ